MTGNEKNYCHKNGYSHQFSIQLKDENDFIFDVICPEVTEL